MNTLQTQGYDMQTQMLSNMSRSGEVYRNNITGIYLQELSTFFHVNLVPDETFVDNSINNRTEDVDAE